MANILSGSADAVVATLTIVADPGMGEILDPPTVGGMTDIAGFESEDMRGRLASCADTVVAGFTGPADHVGVVEKDQGPALGDMTGITWVVGDNMVGMLACGDITVMATFTGTGYLRVIYVADAPPTERRVTVFAGVTRCNVVTPLTLCCTAIVTGEAVAGDIAVIEAGHMPANRGMAIIALIITAYMIHRFARGVGVVMTAIAQHGRTRKPTVDMALIALDVTMLAG